MLTLLDPTLARRFELVDLLPASRMWPTRELTGPMSVKGMSWSHRAPRGTKSVKMHDGSTLTPAAAPARGLIAECMSDFAPLATRRNSRRSTERAAGQDAELRAEEEQEKEFP